MLKLDRAHGNEKMAIDRYHNDGETSTVKSLQTPIFASTLLGTWHGPGGGWCRSGRAGRTVGQIGSSANVESSPLSGRLAVVMFFHQYLSIFVQPWHARNSPSLHAMPRPSSRKRCEWHVSGMLSRHESNAKKNTFFIRTEAYNLHMQMFCPFGCESFTGIW